MTHPLSFANISIFSPEISNFYYIKNYRYRLHLNTHCTKSVRVRSYSGPYFPAFGLNMSPYLVRMRENTDQNNSKYGHFSSSDIISNSLKVSLKSLKVFLINVAAILMMSAKFATPGLFKIKVF